jgi:hypothetical protein
MAEISLSKGKPVARIEGGRFDHKTVYLRDTDKQCCKRHCNDCGKADKYCCKDCKELVDDVDFDDEYDYDALEKLFPKERPRDRLFKVETLRKALIKNTEPLDEELNRLYHKIKKEKAESKNQSLIVNDGRLVHVPSADGIHQRDVLYVAGASGSGKSTYISSYVAEYKRRFPKNKVYIISRLDKDEALDKHNPIRILLDDDFIEDPVQPDELADSLVVFDDTDTIKQKELQKAVNHLKNDILETGRHHRIFMCIVSHLLTNHGETKTVLNECTSVTFFPSSGSLRQITYMLESYIGLTKKDVKKITKMKSRAITVFKHYPQAIMAEHELHLLSSFAE